jgi:hypothetical protein
VAQAEECLPSKFRSHEFKPNTTKKLKEASWVEIFCTFYKNSLYQWRKYDPKV